MQYTSFGRTGLKVSVAGFGCGGYSRIGQQYDASPTDSVALLQEALDLGINFIDTAENYRTEEIVGEAIRHRPRTDVVVCTKTYVERKAGLLSADDMLKSLHESLKKLSTDYIDVYYLHGVQPVAFRYSTDNLLPHLLKAKEAGKIRHIGISEHTSTDPRHGSMQAAIAEGGFDAMMFAFHMMHQNARELVVPGAQREGMGTVAICVMRGFFSNAEAIDTVLDQLDSEGRLPYSIGECQEALDWIVRGGSASNLTEAAYRYARHEPGLDVVLFGTGNRAHLKANVDALLKPPLPAEDREKINRLFGTLEGVGLAEDLRGRPNPRRRHGSLGHA